MVITESIEPDVKDTLIMVTIESIEPDVTDALIMNTPINFA
jgi:hypothetical protein